MRRSYWRLTCNARNFNRIAVECANTRCAIRMKAKTSLAKKGSLLNDLKIFAFLLPKYKSVFHVLSSIPVRECTHLVKLHCAKTSCYAYGTASNESFVERPSFLTEAYPIGFRCHNILYEIYHMSDPFCSRDHKKTVAFGTWHNIRGFISDTHSEMSGRNRWQIRKGFRESVIAPTPSPFSSNNQLEWQWESRDWAFRLRIIRERNKMRICDSTTTLLGMSLLNNEVARNI